MSTRTNYFINGREVTRKQFIFPASMIMLAGLAFVAAVIALLVVTVIAYWENNEYMAIITSLVLAGVGIVQFIKSPKPVTFGNVISLVGTVLVFSGLWQHNIILIIIGLAMNIRLTFTVK